MASVSFLYGACLYIFNIFDFFSRIAVPISSHFAQSIIWEKELKFDILLWKVTPFKLKN